MKNIFLAVFLAVVSAISAIGQDFSTVPKRNFGFGAYLPSGKVAVRAKIGRFIIEDNFKMMYLKADDAHHSTNEIRLMYSFKNSLSKRFYIGTGMDFWTEYNSREYWHSDGYLLCYAGVEFFPSLQVPELSVSPEIMYWNLSNVYANFSVFYYLNRRK